MGKLYDWLYPQVDLCPKCPRDGTCLKNIHNFNPPLQLKECKPFPPTPWGEIKKYKGFQVLFASDAERAAKVAAASGSDGRPILYVNENITKAITGVTNIIGKIFRHPIVAGIVAAIVSGVVLNIMKF